MRATSSHSASRRPGPRSIASATATACGAGNDTVAFELVLAHLREDCDEMQCHRAEGSHVAMARADVRFHRSIATTSRNTAIEQDFCQVEPFARTFTKLTLLRADTKTTTERTR